jgi:hypothetical protein
VILPPIRGLSAIAERAPSDNCAAYALPRACHSHLETFKVGCGCLSPLSVFYIVLLCDHH